MDWYRIYTSNNYVDANIVHSLLQSEGLRVRIQGEALQGVVGEIPPTEGHFQIWVFEAHVSTAQRLVTEYQQRGTSPDWQCPHCQESNPGNFDQCWHCQQGVN